MSRKAKAAMALLTVMGIAWVIQTAPPGGLDFRDPAFAMAAAQAQPFDNWEQGAIRIGNDGPILPCADEDWIVDKIGRMVRTDIDAEKQPSTISNGHWRIPLLSGEMWNARVRHLWLAGDLKGRACKVEWTDEGMRFWCEDGRFDVIFEEGSKSND